MHQNVFLCITRSSWSGLLATCAVLLTSIHGISAAEETRPHIVLILADDLGWSDLGCYGHAWHRTPHLDQLAAEGMRFTNAYAPAPICSASRASILTGKTVARVGLEFVTKNEPGYQQIEGETPLQSPPLTLNLPLQEVTLAEMLARGGYKTAFLGKWHINQHYQKKYLAWHPQFGPLQQGFQFGVEDFGDHPYAWGKQKPADLPSQQYPDDSLVNRAVDYLRQNHTAPFFMMVSLYHVHTPVKNRCRWLVDWYLNQLPEDLPLRERRAEYAAFVETLDRHVGTIVEGIHDQKLRDNTLILFLSDNGGHPEYTANRPLRGSKWNLYEGGIRVPMLARWPGVVSAGSECETPVIGYDLFATFAEIAQVSADKTDGQSIVPCLQGRELSGDRSLLWHFPYYHPEKGFQKSRTEIGIDDFAVSQTRPQSALRKGPYKLIQFVENGRCELYDLSQDLSEQNDLASKQPELTQSLATELEQTLTSMEARRATPRD